MGLEAAASMWLCGASSFGEHAESCHAKAMKKMLVWSAFIRIPARFWSRIGEIPQSRGAFW